MSTKEHTELSVLEEARALKHENAAEHGFDVARIVVAARTRQEKSGRVILRPSQDERRPFES